MARVVLCKADARIYRYQDPQTQDPLPPPLQAQDRQRTGKS